MLIAVLQLTGPCCTWTRTGTLAAVLVVPHEVTAFSVRTREAEGVLAGCAPAAPQPAAATAATATPSSVRHTGKRSRLPAIGRLLSAPLIMPSAIWSPQVG